jgi:hypothetical protein
MNRGLLQTKCAATDPVLQVVPYCVYGCLYQTGSCRNRVIQHNHLKAVSTLGRQDHAAGDLNYAWCLADVLVKKIELRTALLKGYSEKDTALLAQLARHDIPELVKAIEGFADAFRTQWKRSFKPYGLELMQIRLGGLSERCRELARLLEEFLAGSVDSIPELEVKHQPLGHVPHQYFRCVTGCFFV